MSDELDRKVRALTAATHRPALELAVHTIGEAMKKVPGGGARPENTGPDIWTWVDARGKVYAVAPSPDNDGHPMLTIRQPLSKELGTWITSTTLLLGQDRNTVLKSATVALVAHTGAHAGYQSCVSAMAREGDPMDGMARACEIADRDPAMNSAIATALRGQDDDKEPGGLN